ncbi:MAG: hypothetical protein HY926_07035 [Elusimicrobia bacterium]|nr:hypothetical protein [Elusimicrobiota bacterium]
MKFWVYINGEVPGCFAPADLAKLEGFSGTTLVCPAEGEVLEKNWRRAGEFPEIMPVLRDLASRQKPSRPPEVPAPMDVDKVLDSASHRLFGHVSQLMKELEHHREEKALILSLQRQVMDLKDQLQGERDRAGTMEAQLQRFAELEDAQRKAEERIGSLEAALAGKERAASDLRISLEKTRNELDAAKRSLGETANDLSIRNRLVQKLSHDLTEKEVSLTKALALLRRLEEDLSTLRPDVVAGHREQIRALSAPKAEPEAKPVLPEVQVRSADAPQGGVTPAHPEPKTERAAYTTDEPPKLPGVIVPPHPDQPAAHNALVDFLKKVINKPEV